MTIHTLDLRFLDTPGLIAAYLLESQGELALIETGPGSTLPVLCQALADHGYSPQQVKHVFVTHIHLDHAGAAGWWAQQGAQVYCHANAAKHLMDPSRLVESARLVYGEDMDRLWGDVLPAPEGRVTILGDGESIVVGGQTLTAWDTPGHARHHHAYITDGVCFAGDVAGLRLKQSDYLSVTAAPPQFDPPAYIASVDRLLAGNFQRLFLTHFGEITNVRDHLLRYRERIETVHQNVRHWIAEGVNETVIRQRYADVEHATALAHGLSEADWGLHEMSNATCMCADGVRLYVEKNP